MAAGDEKRSLYERAQIGHALGPGKRPAVVVIDLQIGFTDPKKSPLAGDLSKTIEATNRLTAAARAAGAPVLFTVVGYEPNCENDAGLWPLKIPTLRLLVLGGDLVELDPRVERRRCEPVLVKKYASGFFGTPLAATLTARGIDTIFVTGCTTSGCIRATVVDAISHGFRPIVPSEAVGDRAEEPHDANLFDIQAKYGDVVPLQEAIETIERLRQSD